MPRGLAAPPALLIPIDPTATLPLQQQVYHGLREAILTGRLAPGARLPSTRTLASELGVSRNTVVPAFEQLRAEGFVAGRTGGGTRVAAELPDAFLHVRTTSRTRERAAPRVSAAPAMAPDTQAPVSRVARELMRLERPIRLAAQPRTFRMGVPAQAEFPVALWGALMARRWRTSAHALLAGSDPRGYAPLRRAIAAYVGAARGVRCDPDQVLVVGGAQPGLAIAARALLDAGDAVWVEEPGYVDVKLALLTTDARLVPVPVRDGGIDVAEGMRRAPHARVACVTPSNQHPLGGAMPLATRVALLEWAARENAWILEDDYDSEFRYAGRPLPSLQGLDGHGRVVYVGTFSKTLFPALRLGFLVAPLALMPLLVRARQALDRFPPALEQAVLTDFIEEGHFARHVRRMRALYDERQQTFRALAESELGDLLDVPPIDAGLRLLGWLPPGVCDRRVRDEANRRGVEVECVSSSYLEAGARSGLQLGFAPYDKRATRAGLRRLREAILAAKNEMRETKQ